MFKLSKTSKLGTFSWSLQALATCPASLKANGELVDACKGCYATTGFYHMPDAIKLRQANQDDWKRDGWVDDMTNALKKQSHFRWFDSGDVYALPLAEKIYAVMLATPNVKHWMPTRMVKFAKFASIIAKMQALPNVMVRFSSDSIDGTYTEGVHGSVICHDADSAPQGSTVCKAYSNGGKCGTCRDCYSKAIPVIAYPAHGKKMHKIIRIQASA